jgi:hypothetical protein
MTKPRVHEWTSVPFQVPRPLMSGLGSHVDTPRSRVLSLLNLMFLSTNGTARLFQDFGLGSLTHVYYLAGQMLSSSPQDIKVGCLYICW